MGSLPGISRLAASSPPAHQTLAFTQHKQLISNRREMKTFLIGCLLALTRGAPAPQDFLDGSEVDLIELPAVDDSSEDDGPVVIVIKPGAFLPKLPPLPRLPQIPRLPDFDLFSNFDQLPRLPHPFQVFERAPKVPEIDLSSLFGSASEKTTRCGLICQLLRTIDGGLGAVIRPGMDGIRSVLGEELDHHNATYDEKVLPDGSVLRINRTTIHNKDDDGNGFFFHSSVHHIVQDKEDKEEDNTNIEDADVEKDISKEDSYEEEDGEDIDNAVEEKDISLEESFEEEDNVLKGEDEEENNQDVEEPTNVFVGETVKNIFDLGELDEEENEIEVDVKLPTIDVSGIDSGLFE